MKSDGARDIRIDFVNRLCGVNAYEVSVDAPLLQNTFPLLLDVRCCPLRFSCVQNVGWRVEEKRQIGSRKESPQYRVMQADAKRS